MLVYSQVCAPLAQYWNLSCMKSATNYSCNVIFVESNGVYWSSSARASHCRQTFSSRPFSIIRLRNVSSRMNLSWIRWKKTFSCTSSSTGWPKSIPCLLAFYHIDVREVVLPWWRTPELQEGPSYTWWIADSSLFLRARSARTCNRRCLCSSMMNILCTAFQVPSRVIHIIMCFDCGLKRLNDWFCRISCWRACQFWVVLNFLNQLSNAGTLRMLHNRMW